MNGLNQNSIENLETINLKKNRFNKGFSITALSLATLLANSQEVKSQNIVREGQKFELKGLNNEENETEENYVELYDEIETNSSRISEIVNFFKENPEFGISDQQISSFLKSDLYGNVINQQIPDGLNYTFTTYELIDYIIEAKDKNGRIITEDEWNQYRGAVCNSDDGNVWLSDSCFCLKNDACALPIVFDVKIDDLENNPENPMKNYEMMNEISKAQTKALFESSQDFRDFYLNPNYINEKILSPEELSAFMPGLKEE